MEALFAQPGSNGDALFLKQLATDRVAPLEALGRLAARHQGQSAGLVPFRSEHVAVGAQHFPPPSEVAPLVGVLFVNARRLFDATKSPEDDLLVAAFLFWGLLAVHPFSDGNGRTARDLVRYMLMTRWRLDAPPLTVEELAPWLEPALRTLGPANDGSPEAALAQVQTLAQAFEGATLTLIAENPQLRTIASALALNLFPEAQEPR